MISNGEKREAQSEATKLSPMDAKLSLKDANLSPMNAKLSPKDNSNGIILQTKKLSALLRRITSKYHGHFYCLTSLHK